MLGVVENPVDTPRQRDHAQGRQPRWAWATPGTRRRSACCSATNRSEDGLRGGGKRVPDPYFGGEGPKGTGYRLRGVHEGCRLGAKNTLDTNYLYLAERRGEGLPRHRGVDMRRWSVAATRGRCGRGRGSRAAAGR